MISDNMFMDFFEKEYGVKFVDAKTGKVVSKEDRGKNQYKNSANKLHIKESEVSDK